MKNQLIKRINLLFLLIFCLGFQVWPGGNNWDISRSSATESKLFVTYPDATKTIKNDLPKGDPLSGAGETITVEQAMDSIFDDFNSVAAAFVTLVDSDDVDFAARATNRTIKLSVSQPGGLSGGEARIESEDGVVTGCSIVYKSEAYESAKGFIYTMTHELGHCLALAHPQETTWAIMSYFPYSGDMTRLQDDDKMGIIFNFPVDPDDANEVATLGLSCARQE
jgi:hypothetical protein